jgi:hypothetical protein
MPRALNTDKFFHYLPTKSGSYKGQILLGVNHNYKDKERVTLRDLLDHLKKNNIDPSRVKIPSDYTTTVTV